MINVVLCGGNGTRLWPVSRTLYPKQFNKFMSNRSLFQMTVERNHAICDQTLIVSNEEQYFLALDHMEELQLKDAKFLLEPMGRNTAPAIALACLAVDEEELLLITPSDHIVKNHEQYSICIEKGKQLAEEGQLVTFGLTPSYPEIGYGYIEADGNYVLSFKEKPSQELAEKYIQLGNFYWNSGIFMFKAGEFLRELERHAHDIYTASVTAFEKAHKHHDTYRIHGSDMEAIPANSIDYAVIERSTKVKMVPSDFGWSDLGSFEALYDELPKNVEGNTINSEHIGIDSSRNLIVSNDRLVATVDVDDLIIIDTADALLISKQGSSQKVKQIVEELKIRKSKLSDNHVTAYRPWGNHTVLDQSPNYKIRKVIVKPGQKLSIQKHYHRNEHWIVVSGTALITVNGKQSLLRTNESTFIRMGDEHFVENPGRIDLHLIEVQAGEYVEEDDVVRLKKNN
ncbi:mannose-1-phosphate guanylyltransferase/mannose-6-phosphate isomerase [Candidatus Pristimantibacillus sp. PTI5]|uniref:mannose-1-phosphate guanylyltransferase/mannose-6-phosphate isomerase n=1 Tax=Candidatus Pristimantibacillus sp. PTI5 TaxID=3400422 RepID=UPI003B01DB94